MKRYLSIGRLAIGLTSMLLCPIPAFAAVRLPAILSDHMVLLRAAKVPVWGRADPQERVTVQLEGQTRATQADADGHWRVDLDLASAPRTPISLTVRGEQNELVINDVLVGEVWLASGQSNMEKPLGQRHGQRPTFNAEAEIAAANHPDLRLFKVGKVKAEVPGSDVKGEWVRCSPSSIDKIKFSAAAYFFGRKLNEELHVPIGLIDSTYGGTRIELWTPPGDAPVEHPAAQVGDAPGHG